MSGLFGFFERFMPTAGKDVESVDDESVEDYKKSLAVDDHNSSDDEGVVEVNDEVPDYTERIISYKEWQVQRNETLERYFSARLLTDGDDDDNDMDSVEDYDEEEEVGTRDQQETTILQDDDEHDEVETQQPETQQLAPLAQQESQAQRTTSQQSSRQRKIVPNVHETIHEVTWLDDVDLYSKVAHTQLCKVTKLWNHRSTKRSSKLHPYKRFQPILVWNGSNQMERMPLIPIEEDGPLCTIYKAVVNLEVQQLEADPSPNLPVRDVAAAAMAASGAEPITMSRQKMRVFLYNQYATAMQQLLEAHDPKQHLLLLSFQNVPARCIMPYARHHWYDQQAVSEHCLCIGDSSSMRILESASKDNSDNDQPVRARFDLPELEIRVAIGDVKNSEVDSSSFRQFVIGRLPNGRVDANEVTTRTLPLLYKQWKQLTDPRDAAATIHEDTEEPPPPPQQQQQLVVASSNRRRNGESDDTERSLVRNASQHPAGLRHAKRQKSETKYIKMSQLGDMLDTHYGTAAKENYYGSPRRRARNQNCVVNMYGVVLGFGTPKITTRGDFMITVSLVDDSLGLADQNESDGEPASVLVKPLTLVVFCRRKDVLPRLRKAGDVLRLHRVNVQEYENKLQLRGGASTSYVVYYGSSDHAARFQDFCDSPQNYSLTEADEKRFYELWKIGQKHFSGNPTMPESERRVISNIKPQDEQSMAAGSGQMDASEEDPSGDYAVMVTDIIPLPHEQQRSGSTPMGFLRVWDGTGISKSDRMPIHQTPQTCQDSQRGDPPSEALICISKVFPALRRKRSCREIPAPKALCGRVVNAVIWEPAVWEIVTEMVEVGTFIRLRNVQETFLREIGVRCLQVHSRSWLTPLPNACYEVFDLLLNHNRRITSKDPINPQSGVLPIDAESESHGGSDSDDTLSPTRKNSAPESALAELLSQPREASSVTVVARISQTIPIVSSSNDVTKLCVQTGNGTNRGFRFAARVCDPSGVWLDVIISDGAGKSIFGMTASEAHHRSEVAFGFLERAMEEQSKWKFLIKTVHRKGAKFFVAESIEPLRYFLRVSS